MNSSATVSTNRLNNFAVSLLCMLAILDAVFTHVGLQGGHIKEANPLMSFLYDFNIALFFAIKILLPIILMIIIRKIDQNPFIQLLIAGTLFLYATVLIMHVYWFASLFM